MLPKPPFCSPLLFLFPLSKPAVTCHGDAQIAPPMPMSTPPQRSSTQPALFQESPESMFDFLLAEHTRCYETTFAGHWQTCAPNQTVTCKLLFDAACFNAALSLEGCRNNPAIPSAVARAVTVAVSAIFFCRSARVSKSSSLVAPENHCQ